MMEQAKIEIETQDLEIVCGGRSAAEQLTIEEKAIGMASGCALVGGLALAPFGGWPAVIGAAGGAALCGGRGYYLTGKALDQQKAEEAAAAKKK